MRVLRTPARGRRLRAALLATLALAAASCQRNIASPTTQIGPNPILPPLQQYLIPPMLVAPVAQWGDAVPTVPAGLQVQAFARDLEHPRFIYTLPNGDVLVVEANGPGTTVYRPKEIIMNWVQNYVGAGAPGGNRITLLRDTNGDGQPDLRTVFLDNLRSPFGIALVGNDFYVANADSIVRYPYQTGQTRITAPGRLLTELPGGPINHHWTKSLLASPDGTRLYAGVGSNSNITENGWDAERERAAIWEIDRATGAHRIFAHGLRNPNSMQWEPVTGRMWVVVNERDELGPNLVPDYLTSVREGGFYGWPYSYYGQHLDPRVRPQNPALVARAIPPDYALSSHVAPLGLTFYNGTNLPPAFRGGAFIGEHGSWDRQQFNGYKVVFVPFSNGRPSGPARDIVTGFLTPNGDARGRPVGVAVDQAGGLLIADDLGNTVWRVTAAPRPSGA